jgi:hypothetical protein
MLGKLSAYRSCCTGAVRCKLYGREPMVQGFRGAQAACNMRLCINPAHAGVSLQSVLATCTRSHRSGPMCKLRPCHRGSTAHSGLRTKLCCWNTCPQCVGRCLSTAGTQAPILSTGSQLVNDSHRPRPQFRGTVHE